MALLSAGGVTPRLLLAASVALWGCAGEVDGLKKYPVSGTVLVNGKPEKGVAVQFHAVDSPHQGNAASPAGVTDENGEFRLSTNGEFDGAVAGKYIVTFLWVGLNEFKSAPTGDQLRGRYRDPRKSSFEVTVTEGENRVGPFQLTVDSGKPSSGVGASAGRPPR
jgi:hypothetical protein